MAEWEGCRWDGHSGHYESWFQRANHPTRPLAFWIRHTIFCPAHRPEAAQGEIWAMWFDGEQGKTVAGKAEFPRRDCSFALTGLDVKLPGAQLSPHRLEGETGALKWKLGWSGGGEPSLLIPEALYSGAFPKAKQLSVAPNARFSGTVEVAGEPHAIDQWQGSHSHNWGSKHTDRYAWAQVCGFDGAPDVFLECITAQLKVGPVMTPKLTVAVLQLEGRKIELNSISRALRAHASADGFRWNFSTSGSGVGLEVVLEAPKERFVALRYRNPPGGVKACLNSKLAGCTLRLRERGKLRVLTSAHRAAFEILCEENDARVGLVGGFSA